MRALIFLARRIQLFLSLVDREVEILCTNDFLIDLHLFDGVRRFEQILGRRRGTREESCKHEIPPEYGDEQADAARDCRTRLARPNSQARTGTRKKESFNDWGRGECREFIPVLGGDGTKIAPLGDIFDKHPGEMS